MSALDLLTRLRRLGVRLRSEGGRLKIRAPEGVMTEQIKGEIADAKEEILEILARSSAPPESRKPPLTPRADAGPSRLSQGQERLWRLHERSPGSPAYNLPWAFRILGALDADALERSIADLVRRHASLRATIGVESDHATLRVASPGDWELPRTDLSEEGEGLQRRVDQIVLEEARRPFDLSEGPLLRARLIRVSPEEHVFTLVTHHIISDGWSFEVFFDELSAAFEARVTGGSPSFEPLVIDYPDFVAWQREWLTGERLESLRDYWRQRLSGSVQAVRIPSRGEHHERGYEGGRIRAHLDGTLKRDLDALSAAHNVTPLMVLLAGYLTVLHGLTGQDDLVVCTPAACRSEPEVAGMFGFCNNLLALRVSMGGNPTFLDVLHRVRESVLGAFDHQDLPFQEVATLPHLKRIPLTRAQFSVQDDPTPALRLHGLDVVPMPADNGNANFDVGLALEPAGDGLDATLSFKTGVTDPVTMQEVLDDLARVLRIMARDPGASIARVAARHAPVLAQVESAADPATPTWMEAADADAVPVRDPLELQLTIIWERVLDLRGVTPDDDFFDLGGHSLLAVQLLEEMEAELGTVLPLATFFEVSTIAALTAALRDHGWEAPNNPSVTLQAGGDKTPIFVVHSFEGHVFFFNELAKNLAPDHPVFGLQAVGIDGRTRPLETVDEMADHYLPYLRAAQPEGPYVILAMCFGFSVGLELAHRLQADGEDAHFIMLDGGFELLVPEDASAQAGWRTPVRVGSVAWAVRRARGLHDRIRRTLRYLRASPYARREIRMRAANNRAWWRYQPRPYAGDITLIRCADTAADPERAWQLEALARLAAGPSRVIIIEGDHFSVLRAPHVRGLAKAVLQRVELIEQTGARA